MSGIQHLFLGRLPEREPDREREFRSPRGTKPEPTPPTAMTSVRLLALFALFALPSAAALAEDASSGGAHVYQQRLADGRVVLTDRPVDGAQTQRTWQIAREDPDAALRRSEQMRLEAQAVSERIQRRIDQQQARADAYDIERLRVSLAEAQRDAEIARASASAVPVLLLPQRFRLSRPPVKPHPGMRPAPTRTPGMWPRQDSF